MPFDDMSTANSCRVVVRFRFTTANSPSRSVIPFLSYFERHKHKKQQVGLSKRLCVVKESLQPQRERDGNGKNLLDRDGFVYIYKRRNEKKKTKMASRSVSEDYRRRAM